MSGNQGGSHIDSWTMGVLIAAVLISLLTARNLINASRWRSSRIRLVIDILLAPFTILFVFSMSTVILGTL